MYGENTISESTVRWWFGRFRTGNFNLEDEHRGGRPSKLDNDVLPTKINERQDITIRELAVVLDIWKPAKCYADGIFKLPDRSTKDINKNGSYFTE